MPTRIINLVVQLLLFFAAAKCVYLAFFHSLAKVPGPKLYSFWDVPFLYHLVRGDWPYKLKELHDKYGPVVRITSDNVSFISPGAWKSIYGHRLAGQESFQKDRMAYRPTLSGHPNILVANDNDHRRHRRLLAHAFSEKALRGQEDIIKQYVDLLMSKLSEKAQAGEAVDIVRWYNYTTFDLIGDLAFGKSFECLTSGEYHPWVAMIFKSIKVGAYMQVVRRHPILSFLSSVLVPKELMRCFIEHWELSEKTAKRRLASGDVQREDFMSYILRHNDEKGMNEGEIVENANLLIVAGSETTASQLSGTTFYLLTNRDKYDKLVSEIRGAFKREEDINMLSVNELKYMHAVLEEGFRMCKDTSLPLKLVTCCLCQQH